MATTFFHIFYLEPTKNKGITLSGSYIIEDFPSQHWFPQMRAYAREFVNRLKAKGVKCVSIDNRRLNRIIHYYYAYMTEYKQRTYGSRAEDENIDHHKILALYIKAILVSEPFICDSNSGKTTRY